MSIYLKDILSSIKELDKDAMEMSQKRWNSIAKPLNSLGLLEEVVIKMAGITRNPNIDIKKRAVVVMCADNGVVEEGVTQTGQEVTAIVAENMVKGDTSVDNMAKCANVDVIPVDIGIARDMHIDGLIENKLMYGTNNMTKEPAMAKDTAIEAIECGIRIVKDLKDKGYGIIATGEMGIGNTTTSTNKFFFVFQKRNAMLRGCHLLFNRSHTLFSLGVSICSTSAIRQLNKPIKFA